MPSYRRECETCEGEGSIPCDCDLCRTPDGQACGVMGHIPWTCPDCHGEGSVAEECTGCGEEIDETGQHDGFDWYCPECAVEYGVAA